MQTFLPYPDYERSVGCLDMKRLGKQRVEAWQILEILINGRSRGAWSNHPAVKMWKGSERGLYLYGIAVCQEWIRRGYVDNMHSRFIAARNSAFGAHWPWWFGDDRFHASHRSNLLRKYPVWYKQFGWKESDCLPYVWPV
jgi:Pyrimidine dimer DNA glycosylase